VNGYDEYLEYADVNGQAFHVYAHESDTPSHHNYERDYDVNHHVCEHVHVLLLNERARVHDSFQK